MRKEVLFAILVGGLIGVVIAFGFWRANSALDTTQEVATTPEITKKTEEINITLAKPADTSIISTSSTTITGLTRANSIVIISAEKEDYITKSTSEGEFEQEIDLVGGVNEIAVFSFDEEGQMAQEKMLLVYSTELKEK